MKKQNRAAKFFLSLITVIYALAFFALGLFLILADIEAFSLWDTDAFVHSTPGKIVGGSMLLLVILTILLRFLRTRREEFISFENPDGEVIIAISAIEDFLKRLAGSFNEVKEITPSITPLNDGVDVDLRLVLWDDENVHAAVEKIKSIMRDQIQNFFGVANIHSVKIYVTRTLPREKHAEKEQ